MITAVVLDIEGTTSPLAAVHEVLFPYARERIAEFVRAGDAGGPAPAGSGTAGPGTAGPGTAGSGTAGSGTAGSDVAGSDVAGVIDGVRAALGDPAAGIEAVIGTLLGWHDANAKHSPLKTLHGLIWARGFAAGELAGEVYPDVPRALARWRRAGIECWIYSSGSVLAQRLWFGRTRHGDLLGYLAGHFDTVTGGPKREPASYARIAAVIGHPPAEILFLSDSRAELDAARAAGWRAVGVSRPADGSPDVGDHPVIARFSQLRLDAATRVARAGRAALEVAR